VSYDEAGHLQGELASEADQQSAASLLSMRSRGLLLSLAVMAS
jgi:hypothetical protein